MKSKVKALITATSVATLALVGGVAGTLALFNRSVSNTIHIKVGNIGFEFRRVNLDRHALDEDGHLSDSSDDSVIDLSYDGAEAISVEDAAPGAYYDATFELENIGSTAFTVLFELTDYSITHGEDDATADQIAAFVDYTAVTVNEDEDTTQNLGDGLISYTFPEAVDSGDTLTFHILIELDEEMGNDAQDLSVDFGFRLTCTQTLD